MTKNEIVIQKEKKEKDEEDSQEDSEVKNKVETEIVDKVHKEASSDYLFDHTHKFIQNKIFD